MVAINTSNVINSYNQIMRLRGNGGITWGNNSYPANALPAWFNGPTSGIPGSPTDDLFKSPDNSVRAQRTLDVLFLFIAQYAYIRMMRIRIIRTGDNKVLYDQTALGYANTPVTFDRAPAGAVAAGQPAIQWPIDTFIDGCWNNYIAARSTALIYTNQVCHSNCHTNRSRR